MILTRSTRLSQPQGPVEISPDFGGRGVVYLPPVRSGITRVAGAVGRGLTQQGISAIYTAGAETKVELLNGSAPNGVTEFTQIVYLTPTAGGAVNDRGIFGNWSTTGATALVQMVHRARDATVNGRHCYVMSYDPTSGAAASGIRTSDYSAVDNVPAFLVATVKNNTLSLYLNGVLHMSTAVPGVAMSSQADLQIGNYYDNTAGRRLSANVHMAAFLPRGLDASEVAALSRNPWRLFRPGQRRVYFDMGAGGGTTSVASDLTAGYAIQGAVSSDAAASYSIRGGVSAQLDVQYDIRISAFANIGASYDIRGPVSADVAGSYTIRGAASSDSAASYDIRGAAYAATSPAYDIRGPVNADLSASYEILSAASVTADSTCAYPILGSVGSSASTSYGIRGAVASDRSSGYAIRGTVLVDLSTSYAIEAGMSSVYADLSTSYAIEGPVFGGGLSPADITAIRSAVRTELTPELTAVIQIQTKVDATL